MRGRNQALKVLRELTVKVLNQAVQCVLHVE
jgi:hypothetical protein